MTVDVYLDSSCDGDGSVDLSITSVIAYFVAEFCTFPKNCIFLVKRSSVDKIKAVKVDRSTLNEVNFIEAENVPMCFKHCRLPAAVTGDKQIVHLGLSSVLRLIIKSRDEFVYLLGPKQSCLKACAEVSAWTKFCEVQMPSAVEKLLSDTQTAHFADNLRASANIPIEILQLENHFLTPPVVSNSCKRKHEILKHRKGTEANEVAENLNKNVDIELEHIFIEGLDFLLTDLALIPCVTLIFNKWRNHFSLIQPYVRKLHNWYNRVVTLPRVKDVLVLAGLPVFDLELNELNTEQECLNSLVPVNVPLIRDIEKKKAKYNQSTVDEVFTKINSSKVESKSEENPVADVCLPWDSYPCSVHPRDGDLPVRRFDKKCQQLENLAAAVKIVAQENDTIVDFCSGGGHLGLLLAFLLPKCKIILVENKEESLSRAISRIDALGLTNIVVFQSNLYYFDMPFDVGVCLHGCGVATDLVLEKCVGRTASFVLCPCCYGAIQNTHSMTYPRSRLFEESGFSYDDFRVLVHVADQTQFSTDLAETGKTAMNYVDTDRLNYAESHGYRTLLCTLIPPSCSPKNNLLIGVPSKRQFNMSAN